MVCIADLNRGRALEGGLIPKLIETLNSTLTLANDSSQLDQATLLLIRAGVGALLNLSLKYGQSLFPCDDNLNHSHPCSITDDHLPVGRPDPG